MSSVSERFGKIILERRLDKKMTQSKLAKGVGRSRISLYNYEAGIQKPSLEIAVKIAIFLDIKLDELKEEKPSNWTDYNCPGCDKVIGIFKSNKRPLCSNCYWNLKRNTSDNKP